MSRAIAKINLAVPKTNVVELYFFIEILRRRFIDSEANSPTSY